jgi:hypothetical protein
MIEELKTFFFYIFSSFLDSCVLALLVISFNDFLVFFFFSFLNTSLVYPTPYVLDCTLRF